MTAAELLDPPPLERILAAIEFDPVRGIGLAGHWRAPGSGAWPGAPVAADPRIPALQSLLYEQCYVRPLRPPGPLASAAPASLLPLLQDANQSRDRWDPGWEIVDIAADGQTMVSRDVRTRRVWPGEYLSEGWPGMPPRPGIRVRLFVPRGSDSLQPGFYHAFGETLGNQPDEDQLLRFYWNVPAAHAAELTERLTAQLNRYQVPFRFKCLGDAAAYPRCDAAVLYVARRWYAIVAQLASEVHAALAGALVADVPLFTRRLLPGLALAEDPGGAESFGMQRCRLVAEAVVAAAGAGLSAPEARLAGVERVFAEQGLNLALPHLGRAGPDPYRFPVSA